MSQQYLSARQVAERYNRPVRFVYYCKALKEIRRRIGKYLIYLEDDLLQLELRGNFHFKNFKCHNVVELHEKRIEVTPNGQNRLEEKSASRWKFDIL